MFASAGPSDTRAGRPALVSATAPASASARWYSPGTPGPPGTAGCRSCPSRAVASEIAEHWNAHHPPGDRCVVGCHAPKGGGVIDRAVELEGIARPKMRLSCGYTFDIARRVAGTVIGGDQVHAKCSQPVGKEVPDRAEPDDANRLAREGQIDLRGLHRVVSHRCERVVQCATRQSLGTPQTRLQRRRYPLDRTEQRTPKSQVRSPQRYRCLRNRRSQFG